MTEETLQGYEAMLLKTPIRWAAGLVGLISGGAGGYSVFANTNQAGSATLLLLGGVFFLVALTGRVPEKIGKDGVNYQPTVRDRTNARVVDALLADPEPEVQRAAAATYAETRSSVEQALRMEISARNVSREHLTPSATLDARYDENLARARAINLEGNILELLHSRLPSAYPVGTEDGKAPTRLDLALTLPGRSPVGIDVKARTIRQEELHKLERRIEGSGLGGLVVVEAVHHAVSPVRKVFSPSITVIRGTADDSGEISDEFADMIVAEVDNLLKK